jgi:hypothetical protein
MSLLRHSNLTRRSINLIAARAQLIDSILRGTRIGQKILWCWRNSHRCVCLLGTIGGCKLRIMVQELILEKFAAGYFAPHSTSKITTEADLWQNCYFGNSKAWSFAQFSSVGLFGRKPLSSPNDLVGLHFGKNESLRKPPPLVILETRGELKMLDRAGG